MFMLLLQRPCSLLHLMYINTIYTLKYIVDNYHIRFLDVHAVVSSPFNQLSLKMVASTSSTHVTKLCNT
jgi:hypothetical protein